jgi:hypothetical protein
MKKCQMELGNGHKCQKPATMRIGNFTFCEQHAKVAKPLLGRVKVERIK